MTTIGVTGHQSLPELARRRAETDIRALLTRENQPPVGITSLASGADQIFARLVLDHGGSLHVVIPAENYESTFGADDLASYRRLRAAARTVTHLGYDRPDEAAFHAAGVFVVEHCEVLVAVWDGQPARGPGGTADAVAYARSIGRPMLISWPPGVRRP
ncbi:hypothetical protein [Nocardia africana]|uniref:Uncharacterized protein n=1 Tax=Nocardia africana TaxID=134964 RepID=A0A378WYY5_9NOCA|nr:hypothetical protein [Nocardia africana]MCC3312258.1 hypothetical protein [Nocardia africana]SUA46438.1 Uncharacterised protein [Nocardia africana]